MEWWLSLPIRLLEYVRRGRLMELLERRYREQKFARLVARYERGQRPSVAETATSSAVTGKRTVRARFVDHPLLIACAGPATARHVSVWIADGADNERRRTEEKSLGFLRPNDGEQRVVLREVLPVKGKIAEQTGSLVARWTDDEKTHVEHLLTVTVHVASGR